MRHGVGVVAIPPIPHPHDSYRKCPKCATRAFAPIASSEVWTPTASFEGSNYVEKSCLACGFQRRQYVDTHRRGTVMGGDQDRQRLSAKQA